MPDIKYVCVKKKKKAQLIIFLCGELPTSKQNVSYDILGVNRTNISMITM